MFCTPTCIRRSQEGHGKKRQPTSSSRRATSSVTTKDLLGEDGNCCSNLARSLQRGKPRSVQKQSFGGTRLEPKWLQQFPRARCSVTDKVGECHLDMPNILLPDLVDQPDDLPIFACRFEGNVFLFYTFFRVDPLQTSPPEHPITEGFLSSAFKSSFLDRWGFGRRLALGGVWWGGRKTEGCETNERTNMGET